MSDMRAVSLDEDGFDNPPPYGETTETVHKPANQPGFSREYAFSVPGIFKIVQIVLSLVGFITSIIVVWNGGGFVSWTTISAFVTTTILFLLLALQIYDKLPGFWPLYEFIYLAIYTLKYFICTIIAAVRAWQHPSIVFTCVICAVAFLIYLLDCIMGYKRLLLAKEKQAEQRASGEGQGQRRGDSFCIIF